MLTKVVLFVRRVVTSLAHTTISRKQPHYTTPPCAAKYAVPTWPAQPCEGTRQAASVATRSNFET